MTDKRKARKKRTAEDFTPPWLTNQMLEKLAEYSPESWQEGKTFLDPACGTGNMLIEVLKRKLTLKHDPTKAIQSIYGTDIMQDNIRECRLRLLKVLDMNGHEITEDHVKAVMKNIVCTPLSKYPNGSLDYNFIFKNGIKKKDIERWMNGIVLEKWIDTVEVEGEKKQTYIPTKTFSWI